MIWRGIKTTPPVICPELGQSLAIIREQITPRTQPGVILVAGEIDHGCTIDCENTLPAIRFLQICLKSLIQKVRRRNFLSKQMKSTLIEHRNSHRDQDK